MILKEDTSEFLEGLTKNINILNAVRCTFLHDIVVLIVKCLVPTFKISLFTVGHAMCLKGFLIRNFSLVIYILEGKKTVRKESFRKFTCNAHTLREFFQCTCLLYT